MVLIEVYHNHGASSQRWLSRLVGLRVKSTLSRGLCGQCRPRLEEISRKVRQFGVAVSGRVEGMAGEGTNATHFRKLICYHSLLQRR